MALQRAQKQKFCLSTLSNSLRLEVNSPFRITKCAEIIRKKIQQPHRSGVSILSNPLCAPWNDLVIATAAAWVIIKGRQKRSIVFSLFPSIFCCFSLSGLAWGSFHNIERILETPQSIISSIIRIKRSNGQLCLMKVFYCIPALLASCWI